MGSRVFYKLFCCSLLTISLIFLCPKGYAQNTLDSLKKGLKSTADREKRFSYQYSIGHYYYINNKRDSALIAYNKALEIAPKDNFKLQGDALNAIGRTYHMLEDLTNTIKFYKLSLGAYKQAQTEPQVQANILKDLGRAFYGFARYDSAMVYYMQAKEIYESNNIKNEAYGILHHYIGSVFKRQDQMDKACEYYHKEVEYGKEHGFDRVYAEGMYLSSDCMDNDTDRLYNDIKVMRIYEDMDDSRMAGLMYGNVALSYRALGMLDSSLYWHRISLYQRRKEGGKSHLASELADIGHLLIDMHRYRQAIPYFEEAEELAKQTELKKYLRLENIYRGFYELNYRMKRFQPAIEYLKLHYVYKDSARDLDHQNAIDQMEMEYQSEKKEAEIAILEKERDMQKMENQLAKEETKTQKRNRNYFMVGGIILLLLGGYIFIKWRETQRQKVIISVQKNEVEHQKMLVDEKNKDITDSMNYASNIQQAIISSEDYLAEMFEDVFVFYRPRDIVSGDFHWAFSASSGERIFAVGDCTGHGVPGAMMSMLGTAFLNEIVIEGGERDPGSVLNKLREAVKKSLKKSGGKDGMDIALCSIKDDKISYGGANLPLYILRGKELIQIKGDKQPVGYQPIEEKPFTTKYTELKKGDQIYLFSDGFADQFGGPKGKKFKYKAFREKLAETGEMKLKDQLTALEQAFESWKGDLEQVDDVCVIGVRI